MYRHHTGYPGGLKEITLKHLLEKDPEEAFKRTVIGMFPKNSLKKRMVDKNLFIINGQYHPYHETGLP